MNGFADSYLGRLRAVVGDRLLLVPGARIVIERDDGRILMQKRADFGVWGLPGGNAEDGDSVLETIVRETREETGLDVVAPRPFGHGSEPKYERFAYPNGDRLHAHVLMFYTTEFSGELGGDDETLALDWFAPTALPETLPNMVRSIEAYLRFKATGQFQLI